MATEQTTHELSVSEPLFRLATECVHLFSNEAKALETLDDVIASRAMRAADGFPGHASETIGGHLDTLSTEGTLRIALSVDPETDEHLAAAREALAVRLDRPVTLADTVSVLLFDLTIDHASASMLEQLLGGEARARVGGGRLAGLDATERVVPIR